jgi:phage terminase small subunit
VRIKSDALRHLRSSLSQFGLDPASRSAIKTDDQPHNPLEDFLSGDTAGEVVQ